MEQTSKYIEDAMVILNSDEFINLEEMTFAVFYINKANGWFDSERTFGDDIALLHSEVSEAFEAYRIKGNCDDQTLSDANGTRIPKPEGVGSELADVLVRLLDTCNRYNIDLEAEFVRKCKYNATRGYRHGDKAV